MDPAQRSTEVRTARGGSTAIVLTARVGSAQPPISGNAPILAGSISSHPTEISADSMVAKAMFCHQPVREAGGAPCQRINRHN